jgi:hypothetical protein
VVVSSNCGNNRKQIEKAARKAEKAIRRCLSCEEKDRLKDIDTITIQCTTTIKDIWGQTICAERIIKQPTFFLTPLAFIPEVCGCLEGTLMHEALHLAGRGNDQHNEQGGFDDVQKCIPCAKEK